jgi:hypothetical protein
VFTSVLFLENTIQRHNLEFIPKDIGTRSYIQYMNPSHNTSQVLDQHEDLPDLPNFASSFIEDRENDTVTQPVGVIGGISEEAVTTPIGTDRVFERGNNAKYGALIRSKIYSITLSSIILYLNRSTNIFFTLCRSL